MAFGDVLKELTERGYIHQQTPGLEAHFAKGMVTAYVGYDCTALSLHAGSLVSIMMLRILQKHGHRPIVLMGGGTSRVGDPSGKDTSRQLMSTETIESNLRSIQR